MSCLHFFKFKTKCHLWISISGKLIVGQNFTLFNMNSMYISPTIYTNVDLLMKNEKYK